MSRDKILNNGEETRRILRATGLIRDESIIRGTFHIGLLEDALEPLVQQANRSALAQMSSESLVKEVARVKRISKGRLATNKRLRERIKELTHKVDITHHRALAEARVASSKASSGE